ncbi:MAG: DUF4190 domain-containing protein [Acidimicrobiales bacterium]
MSDVPPGSDQPGWSGTPQGQPPPGYGAPGGGYGRPPSNGMGTGAMVVGIVALLLSWIPFLGLILAIVALVLGIIGLKKVKRGEATNKGQAVTGVVTGAIAAAIGVAFIVIGIAFFSSDEFQNLNDCLQDAATGSEQQACQQEFQQDFGN